MDSCKILSGCETVVMVEYSPDMHTYTCIHSYDVYQDSYINTNTTVLAYHNIEAKSGLGRCIQPCKILEKVKQF